MSAASRPRQLRLTIQRVELGGVISAAIDAWAPAAAPKGI